MKKFTILSVTSCILMALFVVANASSDDSPAPPDQEKKQASGQGAISGKNDIRIITPDMTHRERIETQRNIKKRAAAKRNSLMRAAQLQRQQDARRAAQNIAD